MPALVAGTHVFQDLPRDKTWIAGTYARRRASRFSPAMTDAPPRFAAFDIVVVPFPYADRLAESAAPR
jgi:hypothetical protein